MVFHIKYEICKVTVMIRDFMHTFGRYNKNVRKQYRLRETRFLAL